MMKQGYRREMSHFSVTTVTTVILDDSLHRRLIDPTRRRTVAMGMLRHSS